MRLLFCVGWWCDGGLLKFALLWSKHYERIVSKSFTLSMNRKKFISFISTID